MSQSKLRVAIDILRLAFAGAVLAIHAPAQVTATGIHGIVRDPSGAVIPRATLRLRDSATGLERVTVSSSDGVFAFVGLLAGSYQLTAAAAGFQSAVLNSVLVDSGRITDVSIDLEIGAPAETVDVSASATQLDLTSNEIGATINNNLIQNLPYSGRDTLAFALLMAGNASANDASGRNSTFNGLPNASMNISLDGMNNNSQRFKSGGTSFFQYAPARLDAIEQVTVSTGGLGADAAGEGAMNIRLVTKRGTNVWHGKILEQFRNEALSANTFFNNLRGLPRSKVRENDAVGAIGGPLLPFIPYMKNRLFFFAYFEGIPQPGTTTSEATILTAASQAGDFTYIGADGIEHRVNLLQAAGGALDPTIKGILGSISATRAKANTFIPIAGQPYWESMQWKQPTNTITLYPAARVDYNIHPSVAWHGGWNLRYQNNAGTPQYPGSPYDFINSYKITTYIATNSVDWIIRPTLLNNFTFGIQSNGEYYYRGADPHQYSVYGNRIINFPLTFTQTINPYVPSTTWQPFIRNNPVFQWTENLSWVKGKHTITLGGTALRTTFWETSFNNAGVLGYNFGIVSSDPVATVLQNALPGINTNNGDLTNAQNLYALLTGRLTSISTTVNVDEKTRQYRRFSPLTQRYAFTTAGFYAQDTFRLKPGVTVNYGLRWQLDGAIHSTNGINSEPFGANFFGPSNGPFQPGVLNGNSDPVFVQVSNPYHRDFRNFAPNLGIAWNPAGDHGLIGKLLGNRKTVVRASFAITYYNEGLNTISNVLSAGKGTTQAINATQGVQFPAGSLNLSSPVPPLNITPASFGFPLPQAAYTFQGSYSGSLVDPNLRSPYVTSWTFGVQRELPHHALLEIRYIGNKATHIWHYQNIQETNIFENGFLAEFLQARKNLNINRGSGVNSFANTGRPGEAPLPIFEAAFGPNGPLSPVAAGQGFGSAGFITHLDQGIAGGLADALATNITYYCRLVGSNFGPCANAGYTAPGKYSVNLFRMNPYLNAMNYQTDNANTNYNALQVVLRHDYGGGLSAQANYTWAHTLGDFSNTSDQTGGYTWFTIRNSRLNYGPTPFDRRHVFNAFFTYDLPLGRGRRFKLTNPVLEGVAGGWTIGWRNTIATGNPVLLNGGRSTVNNLTQGGVAPGVVLNGITLDQLQHALSTVSGYFAGARTLITDISSIAKITASSSTANPAIYAPASTPGEFGQILYLRNNTQYQFDFSLNKDIRLDERRKLSLKAEALNFLNHPFFPLADASPISTSFGQISPPPVNASGARSVLLRGSIEW